VSGSVIALRCRFLRSSYSKDYRNTKAIREVSHIDERGRKETWGLGAFGEINFAGPGLRPREDHFVLLEFHVSDRDEKSAGEIAHERSILNPRACLHKFKIGRRSERMRAETGTPELGITGVDLTSFVPRGMGRCDCGAR